MKISFPVQPLPHEIPEEGTIIHFDLHEEFFSYSARYHAEMYSIPGDKQSGMKTYFRCWKTSFKRSGICCVNLEWIVRNDVWMVQVSVPGANEDMVMYFDKKKLSEAERCYNLFNDYMRGASLDSIEQYK